jgi:hypothetical protein
MNYRLEVGPNYEISGVFESAFEAVEHAREQYEYNTWRVVDMETQSIVWFNEPSTQLVEQMLGEQTRFDRTERVARRLSENRTQRTLDALAEHQRMGQRAAERRRRLRQQEEENFVAALSWKEYGF